ncbi:MAG: DUF1361 domain-containing protein [Candidatus Peregrinibacteria bacterium]
MVNHYPLLMVAWNTVLALIPCLIAYYLAQAVRGKRWETLNRVNQILFTIVFLVWLFFLPNTAYLFTMVRHLLNHCEAFDPFLRVCREEAWMVMFFLLYALVGLPTFIYALRKMSRVFHKTFGAAVGEYLPLVIIPFTTLGVLMGLIDRLNSWEVLTRPLIVIEIGLTYFADAYKFWNLIAYAAALFLIYYGIGHALRKILK